MYDFYSTTRQTTLPASNIMRRPQAKEGQGYLANLKLGMWDAKEGSLTWKQIGALCLRLPALYPWVSLGSPASWEAHQPIKGGAWFAHRCRNTPFILPQLFPDYQLKSQGSSHIFFFDLHFFYMLFIAPAFNSKPLSSSTANPLTPQIWSQGLS